jgi:DNA repair exonuclease SbcCD ATPase subunit
MDKLSLYFILGVVGLIALIVLYNSDTILSRFGFETTSTLKSRVTQLEEQNKLLTQTNEQLVKDIEELQKRKEEEIKAIKEHYEYKIAQYEEINKVQDKLKEENKQLAKKLEEQKKKLATSCKLDEKKYYLYDTATYNQISTNNYNAITSYYNMQILGNTQTYANKTNNINTTNPTNSSNTSIFNLFDGRLFKLPGVTR